MPYYTGNNESLNFTIFSVYTVYEVFRLIMPISPCTKETVVVCDNSQSFKKSKQCKAETATAVANHIILKF